MLHIGKLRCRPAVIYSIGKGIEYCQGNEIFLAGPVQRSIISTTIEDHFSAKMDRAAYFILQNFIPRHEIFIIYG